jgi:hypothetical protein
MQYKKTLLFLSWLRKIKKNAIDDKVLCSAGNIYFTGKKNNRKEENERKKRATYLDAIVNGK